MSGSRRFRKLVLVDHYPPKRVSIGRWSRERDGGRLVDEFALFTLALHSKTTFAAWPVLDAVIARLGFMGHT